MTDPSVKEIFGLNIQRGEVGIEIEIEGADLPHDLAYYWRTTRDGSLRGEAREYVLKQPVKRGTCLKALNHLYKQLSQCELQETGNAGIHIHINMQEATMEQSFTFACLYLLFEDALVRFCGSDRIGNLFCLRAKDADYLVEYLTNVIISGNWHELGSDHIRYSSVNLSALQRFGSIEFRALRSTLDLNVILTWINILLRLKDTAMSFDNIRHIPVMFSHLEQETFIEYCLGEYGDIIRTDEYYAELTENMWRLQGLIYEFDISAGHRQQKQLSHINPLKF